MTNRVKAITRRTLLGADFGENRELRITFKDKGLTKWAEEPETFLGPRELQLPLPLQLTVD